MRTSDLIFHSTENSAWDSAHIHFTLIVGGVSLLLSIVFGVVAFVGERKHSRSALTPGINKPENIVISILFLLFALFVPVISASVTSLKQDDTVNHVAVQEWVKQNYVIDLTDKQAESLYDNSATYEYDNSAFTGRATIVSYYGDNVMVNLTEYKKDWRLFSNGKELPQVEKKQK